MLTGMKLERTLYAADESPRIKHRVMLTDEERATLQALIGKGRGPARLLAHARILLQADAVADGVGWSDSAIATALRVSIPTIARVRRRFVEVGLEAALGRRPRSGTPPRKFDGHAEAQLIALACSDPPSGHARWTRGSWPSAWSNLRWWRPSRMRRCGAP